MKELEIIIKQEEYMFRLDIKCESNAMNKRVIQKVIGRYNESESMITASLTASSIIKLVSVQMILITELNENGQI